MNFEQNRIEMSDVTFSSVLIATFSEIISALAKNEQVNTKKLSQVKVRVSSKTSVAKQPHMVTHS